MNILILTQRWYPDTFGGSEHVASEQARRLALRGHHVTVLTERVREALPEHEEQGNLEIIRYGSPAAFSRMGGSSRTDVNEVRKFFCHPQQVKFDVVIAHHPFPAYGFLKSGATLPWLYVFHASTAKEVEFEGARRELPVLLRPFTALATALFVGWAARVEGEVLRRASRIAVLSEFSLHMLMGMIPRASQKTMLLPVGIDRATFIPGNREEARRRLGLGADKKIILTVRRFTPRMGIQKLIHAMQSVVARDPSSRERRDEPNVQVLIVGEGQLRGRLQEEIMTHGLQGIVTLTGAVPLPDLPLYYRAADLFVLPTEAFEGLGMSTLEALSCGVPVVGTPAGATPELLRNLDPALITKSSGKDDLAQGIIDFFARPEAERDALSKKARKFIEEHYDWEKAIDALESTLSELLNLRNNESSTKATK